MDLTRQSQLASILGSESGSTSSGLGTSPKSLSGRPDDIDARMDEEVGGRAQGGIHGVVVWYIL